MRRWESQCVKGSPASEQFYLESILGECVLFLLTSASKRPRLRVSVWNYSHLQFSLLLLSVCSISC